MPMACAYPGGLTVGHVLERRELLRLAERLHDGIGPGVLGGGGAALDLEAVPGEGKCLCESAVMDESRDGAAAGYHRLGGGGKRFRSAAGAPEDRAPQAGLQICPL